VHVLIDEKKLKVVDETARLAEPYEERRKTKDGVQKITSVGIRHGFTLLRSHVLERKQAGVWPPVSPELPDHWKGKATVAKDLRGIIHSGKERNEFYAEMNVLRERDPTIAQIVWLKNAKGRFHPRTRWDSEKLATLLEGTAPPPPATPPNGAAAAGSARP